MDGSVKLNTKPRDEGTTHVSLPDARLTLFTMTYRSTNQTVQWMRNIYNVYKTTTFCAEKL